MAEMKLFHRQEEDKVLTPSEVKQTLGKQLSFAATEAYKLLRTNLLFSFPDDGKCKIVGVTSSLRGEGKSTTAINLAYSIAETGRKVLLIEADMRMPVLAERLSLPKGKGLSNVLVGMCSLREALQVDSTSGNLYVIPSGDIPPNPSELLGSQRMTECLNYLANTFDYILIDLPPIQAVTDSLVVSKLVNGMILVVRRNHTERRILDNTIRQLQQVDAKVLGLVMTHGEVAVKNYKKYGYGYGYYKKDEATGEKGKV